MKIRISTLLLLTALAVLAAVWLGAEVRSQRNTNAHNAEMFKVVDGGMRWTLARNRLRLLRYYRLGPNDFEKDIEFHLVSDVFELSRLETEIDRVVEIGELNATSVLADGVTPDMSASKTATELLEELGCQTFSDYYQMFLKRFDFDTHEKFRDNSSQEYRALRQFVETALETRG